MLEGLKSQFVYIVSYITQPLTIQTTFAVVFTAIKDILLLVLPFSFVVLIAGVLGNVAQIGFLFTTKPRSGKPG